MIILNEFYHESNYIDRTGSGAKLRF